MRVDVVDGVAGSYLGPSQRLIRQFSSSRSRMSFAGLVKLAFRFVELQLNAIPVPPGQRAITSLAKAAEPTAQTR